MKLRWTRTSLPACLALLFSLTLRAETLILTNAAQVRGLAWEDATRGCSVRLKGVITYCEPTAQIAFLQDATAGVMLSLEPLILLKLQPGTLVSLAGVTIKSRFAPAVKVSHDTDLQILGASPLPKPLSLGLEDLQCGQYDAQWIEMRGVIRSVRKQPYNANETAADPEALSQASRLLLEISTAQGRYTAILPWEAYLAAPRKLLDSGIRLEGVLGSIVNARGQWVGLLVYVPGIENIHVERAASSDPFQVSERKLSQILTFSAEKPADERVRVTGTLLMNDEGNVGFIRTSDGAIELHGEPPSKSKCGDCVEASGYPTLLNKRVFLDDCLIRLVSSGQPPEPVQASVVSCLESDLHGELVKIRGELLQNTRRLGDALLILNSDGQSVEASVSQVRLGSQADRIAALRPGSLLELQGVAQILTSMQPSGNVRPVAFRLRLNGPDSVQLLRAPTWWTPQRLLGLVGALVASLGLVATWVVLLRRQVGLQTEIIKEKVEREAVWRDRSRIAQDIHDDLGASLTQVGFLVQRIQAAKPETREVMTLAERISDLSRSTVRALDEIVWAVNPRHDSLQSLADYLVILAGEQLALAHINCLMDIPAVLPEVGLRADIRHNLVLAVKEALHNVVKHSRAGALHLALRLNGQRIEVTIRDDGIGFSPAVSRNGGRNGLTNISRRLKEIGGDCDVETAPGQGTRLCLSVPLPSLKPIRS